MKEGLSKRILAVFLCFIMVFSASPLTVFSSSYGLYEADAVDQTFASESYGLWGSIVATLTRCFAVTANASPAIGDTFSVNYD